MGSLTKHFERELAIMRQSVDTEDKLIIEPYVESIKNLLEIFSNEGHSGASAPLCASVIAKTIKAVLGFQILSPLTGEESEWNDISETHGSLMYQNSRDSGVFKDEQGKCSYGTSIVWVGEDRWDTFTGAVNGYKSTNYIKEFPFMPKTFYINVSRELYDENNPEHKGKDIVDTGHGQMVYSINDPKQITEVFNYYNQKQNEKSI
jgi:hypothetical protein